MSIVHLFDDVLPVDLINIITRYSQSSIKLMRCSQSFTSYTYNSTSYTSIGTTLGNNKNSNRIQCMAFCVCSVKNLDYLLIVCCNSPRALKVLSLPSHQQIAKINPTVLKNGVIHTVLCQCDILVLQMGDYIATYSIDIKQATLQFMCVIYKKYYITHNQICKVLFMNDKYIIVNEHYAVEIYDHQLTMIKRIPIDVASLAGIVENQGVYFAYTDAEENHRFILNL